jgi:hypothetical protein
MTQNHNKSGKFAAILKRGAKHYNSIDSDRSRHALPVFNQLRLDPKSKHRIWFNLREFLQYFGKITLVKKKRAAAASP